MAALLHSGERLILEDKKMDLIHHTKKAYDDFFQSAHQDGALDAKTKRLIHLALVLAMRCEP
jgi:alkylhydroperoxidase/carboxymuconolactone decarboxylase family protein YurZ